MMTFPTKEAFAGKLIEILGDLWNFVRDGNTLPVHSEVTDENKRMDLFQIVLESYANEDVDSSCLRDCMGSRRCTMGNWRTNKNVRLTMTSLKTSPRRLNLKTFAMTDE